MTQKYGQAEHFVYLGISNWFKFKQMKKILTLLYILTLAWAQFSCKSNRSDAPANASSSSTAQFTQNNRAALVLKHSAVVDTLMAQFQRAEHLSSISYGLVMDDTLIYSQSVGLTNPANGRRPDAHTPFRIASMTKSLTALAILKLAEEGKLDLHQPAENYLPELAGLVYPTPDAPKIAIHHLMTMTAGFPEDNPWGDRQLSDTDEELLQLIREGISFSTSPGTGFEYSNLGYAILGQIVQRVSGMPYRTFMDEQIFKPLGMQESYWDFDGDLIQPLAHGYRWEEDQWKEEPLLKDGAYACMGGLICTIADWGKYMVYLMSAWSDAPAYGPVSKSSLRLMQSPWAYRGVNQRLDALGKTCAETSFYGYGLGWRRTCKSLTYLAHSGGLPGYGSIHIFVPELSLGIVAFSNGTYAGVGAPALKALDTLITLTELAPRTRPVSVQLQQAKNELIKLLPDLKNDQGDTIFAENFYLDESKLLRRKSYQEVFQKIGSIQTIGEIMPMNNLRGTFEITGEKGALEVFFTMSPETLPKIQALDIKFLPGNK